MHACMYVCTYVCRYTYIGGVGVRKDRKGGGWRERYHLSLFEAVVVGEPPCIRKVHLLVCICMYYI